MIFQIIIVIFAEAFIFNKVIRNVISEIEKFKKNKQRDECIDEWMDEYISQIKLRHLVNINKGVKK